MKTLKFTRTVTTERPIKDIYRVLKGKHPSRADSSYSDYDRLLRKVCDLIRMYKWEILETYQGYKVITNGYKAFKRVELNVGGQVAGKVVIDKLFKILTTK